jgi:hypothetical protein
MLSLLFCHSAITSEDMRVKISLHSRGITALLLVIWIGVAPEILESDANSGTLSTTVKGFIVFEETISSVWT